MTALGILGAGPLPDVADRVDQPELVGREGADRGGADPAQRSVVAVGEAPLPGVGHQAAIHPRLVPPRIPRGGAGPRGVFELGFGGQSPARPGGVGAGVRVGHLHHRVVLLAGDIAARAEGGTPVGARRPVPPLPPIVQIDGAGAAGEDQRAGQQVLGRDAGVQRRVQWPLGDGDVAGVGDESGELRIGHRVAFDGERPDGGGVDRRFLGIEARRPHPERAARDLDEFGQHGFRLGPLSVAGEGNRQFPFAIDIRHT